MQTANRWDEATQAKKLPTLLEGEALMTYLEMPEDDPKKYFQALKVVSRSQTQPSATRSRGLGLATRDYSEG